MSFIPLNPHWFKTGDYWFDLWDQTPRDQWAGSLVFPEIGTKLTEDAAMFLALSVALRGVGNVSPNPLVGAVVLDRDRKFLAAGCHQQLGQAHAEVDALSQIDSSIDLSGASLFVTLEPCAHEGKTPSCAKMIAGLKLSKVVYGARDPNPLVDGQGVQILRAAGIEVELSSHWQSRCEWLMRVFMKNQRRNEIYIGLKVASTPSGVIAGDGTSRLWITGERARQMGHFLRLEYDAIIVGINTVLLDDPTLNVRHPVVQGRTPLRLILDPKGVLLTRSLPLKILTEFPERTLVVWPEGIDDSSFLKTYGVKVLKLPITSDKGLFNWEDIKRALWSRGIRSLLIEGGAGLYQSAMAAQVVDGWHWFIGAEKGAESGAVRWEIPQQLRERLSAKNSSGDLRLGDDRLIEE